MSEELRYRYFTCGCQFLVYLALLVLGGVSSNYLIMEVFNKNISFFYDLLISFLSFHIIIPIGIVWWILKQTGVL
jgi:hypothetical protein